MCLQILCSHFFNDALDGFKLRSLFQKRSISRPKTNWLCNCLRLTFISSKLSWNIWPFFYQQKNIGKLITSWLCSRSWLMKFGSHAFPYLGLQNFHNNFFWTVFLNQDSWSQWKYLGKNGKNGKQNQWSCFQKLQLTKNSSLPVNPKIPISSADFWRWSN